METKELKITIPENHEIDWQESAKQEKIVFKKKDTKPRSWEEYLKQHKDAECYTIGYDFCNGYCRSARIYEKGDCTVPSKELAEAFLAMMQLMSLRQAWIGDWKPNWKDYYTDKYCIKYSDIKFAVGIYGNVSKALSFPSEEMATNFMNCFKDLLNVAKPLI